MQRMSRDCLLQSITADSLLAPKKITYSMSGNETKIDFVLVGKNNRKYLKDMKNIP